MSEDEQVYTTFEIDSDVKKIDNEAATSVGISEDDGINYRVATDDYEITKVYDDVILGEYVNKNKDEDGFTTTDSGLVFREDGSQNKTLYEVVKVQMVGRDVKETAVGDLVVVSTSAGMQVVDFDGRDCVMVSEKNIFMQVKEKD